MKSLASLQLAALVALTCFATAASAAGPATLPDLSQWSCVAAVKLLGPPPAKGLIEAALSPEIFARSQADLADLRLTTAAGQLVPYVIRIDRGTPPTSVSYRPVRTFNPVFLPGKQSAVTVEFAGRAPRTRLDIDTPGTNFRRRVMIEASADNQAWQVLVPSAWLFRIAYAGGSYSRNEVALPDNDFLFLRVTVFNAPDDPEQLEIRDVLAWNIKTVPPPTLPVDVRSQAVTEDAKIKATQLDADLGFENLPIYELTLSCHDANFLRRVEVLGRNVLRRTFTEPVENGPARQRQIDEPWAPLTSGTIHRFPGTAGQAADAGLTLWLDARCRYLRVLIYNGDDATLASPQLAVRRLQYYLSFQPQEAETYRLYTGNLVAEQPNYDLTHFADRLRGDGVTAAAIGPVEANPQFAVVVKVVPWSERYAVLLWAALLVVLVVLSVLVIRLARAAKPAN